MINLIHKALLLLAFIFTTVLFAGDPKLKDYPEAQELEQKAENGDEIAAYDLGRFYDKELNDEKKAIYWFTKGCGKWDKDCAYLLAKSMWQDRERSRIWLKKAYKMGSAEAAYELGFMEAQDAYERNQHLRDEEIKLEEFANSIKWYEIADKMGNKDAAFDLGDILRYYDCKKSYQYYEKAFNRGHERAAYELARTSCDKNETKSSQNSIKWYKIAYEKGDISVASPIAYEYKNMGDRANFIKWLETAYNDALSEKKISSAVESARKLGGAYRDFKDYPNAIKWYEIAYRTGDGSAAFSLGLLYEKELKDYPNAIKWYKIDTGQFGKEALNELNKKLSQQESNSTISTDLNSSK